ncbi:MAG: dipeptidase PepV [Clostridia bacterium]|nr:dipeptidase PepV [Clostridia bacterium]
MSYQEYIQLNRSQMVQTLKDLIKMDTKQSRPFKTKEGEIYPFGKGVGEAFNYLLKAAEEMGFEVENVDNYGGHIDMPGYILDEEGDIERTGAYTLGILAHLDVVPEGEGWKVDPFGAVEKDGKIYGRGTQDDKGPLVCALYAMKALKDSGYVPAKKVRLIVGLDEETGWEGMDYYFRYMPKPDFGFTPDAEFPVISGEKGILTFKLAKKIQKTKDKGLELRSISGGAAPNMVPASARAVVRAEDKEVYEKIKDKASAYRDNTGNRINIKGVGKSLEIVAMGKSAHGAHPEEGLNAISILMDFLKDIYFVNEDVNQIIADYVEYIGMKTKVAGATFNVGQVQGDDESITLTVNVRYDVDKTDEDFYSSIQPVIEKLDVGLIKERHQKPIYFKEDHPLIKCLMKVYQEETGDYESKPLVIGGGSYARAMDNAVAFGALFPGDEDRMHQKDEYISIDNLEKLCSIYAKAIYELTKDEEMSFE